MLRLILIACFFCAPCFAVVCGDEGKLALESMDVSVQLIESEQVLTVEVTCTAVLHNPAEAFDTTLMLPSELIPKTERETCVIRLDTVEKKVDSEAQGQLIWQVHFDTDQSITVSWTRSIGITRLPQAHPLGRCQLTVQLGYMRGFVSYPDTRSVVIRHDGLAPELFDQTDDGPISLEQRTGARVQDFSFSWFETTLVAKTKAMMLLKDSFKEAQRTHENRSYTDTLVRLTELHELAGDNQAVAETCKTLAKLEADAGHAITHCGPWAEWRRYVPWQFRRLRALKAEDAKDAAVEAVAAMAARWAAYQEARRFTRPFDHFDAITFGNFWDYDWVATRDLYATALELTGDGEGAQEIRKDSPPD